MLLAMLIELLLLGWIVALERGAQRFIPSHGWYTLDTHTGQFCDSGPPPYATAWKDSAGVVYCTRIK
jgi:hypothetical protein